MSAATNGPAEPVTHDSTTSGLSATTDVDKASESGYTNPMIQKIADYFEVQERQTTFRSELLGGVVMFMTMSYILAVNASILSDSGGPCGPDYEDSCIETFKRDLITATAACACIATLFMGLAANMPLGLAPGMGINAYFTYNVVGFRGSGNVSYQTALCAVFIEGVIFLILSVTGLRIYIARMIPKHLKSSIGVGIGLFLALIGCQTAEGIGLVVNDGATNVTLGGCGFYDQTCQAGNLWCGCDHGGVLEGGTTWLGIMGVVLIAFGLMRGFRGSVIVGILFVSLISWFRNTDVTYFPDTAEGNDRFDYFKQIVRFHSIESTGFILFDGVDFSSSDVWVALLTMLYVDILDTTGTLYSMADFAGLVDERGDFPRSTWAFTSDAIGTILGSFMGTPDTTAYIESAAGIHAGGRTGLTAVVVGLLFFLSLFFNPIFASIPPWATGPALIIVGALMMDSVTKIKWDDLRQAMPAFVSIVVMPFTYSIAYGIIGGLVMHFVIVALDFLFDAAHSACCQSAACCKPEGDRLECCCLDAQGRPSGAVLSECLREGPCGRFIAPSDAAKGGKGGDGNGTEQQQQEEPVELETK